MNQSNSPEELEPKSSSLTFNRRDFMKALGVGIPVVGAAVSGFFGEGVGKVEAEGETPTNAELSAKTVEVAAVLGYTVKETQIVSELTGQSIKAKLIVPNLRPEVLQINDTLPVEERVTPTELITQAATSNLLRVSGYEQYRELFEAVTYTPEKRDHRLNVGPYSPMLHGKPLQQVTLTVDSAEIDVNPYTQLESNIPGFTLGRPDVNLVYNFIYDTNPEVAVMLDVNTYLRTANLPGEIILSLDAAVTFNDQNGTLVSPANLDASLIPAILNGNQSGWTINVPHNTAFAVMALPFDSRQEA
jgi:hypothetical protein